MSNIRELRLAIQSKLEDRKRLIARNARLRGDVQRAETRADFLLDTLKSPLVNMEMERCADEIINAVLDEALKASTAIAEQTVESGDYVVGIDIPSLHIRRRLFRLDVKELGPVRSARVLQDVAVKMAQYPTTR